MVQHLPVLCEAYNLSAKHVSSSAVNNSFQQTFLGIWKVHRNVYVFMYMCACIRRNKRSTSGVNLQKLSIVGF